MNQRVELIKWKEIHGSDLQLGSMVNIKPSCKYYDPEWDQGQEYMVTYLYIDSDGLNIGINDGGSDSWLCSEDGYRFDELEPV